MSIAVSTVVKPSRLLFALVTGACIGVAIVGAMLGSGYVSGLALPVRLSIAAACLLIAILGFYRAGQTRKTHHIDISGIGQIRLVEHSALTALPRELALSQWRHGDEVVSLMSDSTLWPFLLLLRLRTCNDQIKIVPILPDSVDADAFRRLSVACRWIAAHNDSADRPVL
jgi:hypothetical protein